MKKLLPLALAIACGAVFAQNAQIDKKDREFMEKAAAGGMLEVEVGKMAEQKAQNPDVKSMGSMLNTDHTAANQELMALAQKKGVTLPTALPKKEQKTVDKLSKSKNFDKDFTKDAVSDHKKDIKEFEKQAKSGKDADIKNFAETTLPTLKQHLQMAQEIEHSMRAQSPMASKRGNGAAGTAGTSTPTQR